MDETSARRGEPDGRMSFLWVGGVRDYWGWGELGEGMGIRWGVGGKGKPQQTCGKNAEVLSLRINGEG